MAHRIPMLVNTLRWYQTTTIRPPTELPYSGSTTIDTGPLVAFIKEIARLSRRAASWTAFAALLEGLATIAQWAMNPGDVLRANPKR
jgi:hypothetical protein